ncbi:hypothetical protein Tco_0524156 [Tanacetum coccineum]
MRNKSKISLNSLDALHLHRIEENGSKGTILMILLQPWKGMTAAIATRASIPTILLETLTIKSGNTTKSFSLVNLFALMQSRKMEDEFYGLTVNGSDLKTYIRRFQELAFLCPNMVPNSEKLVEAFIGGLSQSIEGNVTASKPQTLEEATPI